MVRRNPCRFNGEVEKDLLYKVLFEDYVSRLVE